MRLRLVPLVTLVCLAAVPTVARPAEEASKPTVVVRVDSIDNLMADFRYLAALGGKENQAQQFEGLAKNLLGGGKGIDHKRPIYVYASVSPNGFDSSGVVLIPVADEKGLLDLLERFNMKPEKGDDGVYTVKPIQAPFDVYFRFAHQYAYATARDKSAIDKDKLIEPGQLLPGVKHATATVLLRLDQIPDGVKQIALGQMDLKLAEAKEKKEPGETEAQSKLKGEVIDQVAQKFKDVINDGGDMIILVNVDRKSGELAAEFSLAGKPGSGLATHIAELGHTKSLFGSALGGESALTLLVHGTLSPELQKTLGPAVDEGIEKGLQKEQDPAKRELGSKLLKALAPTLKAGALDLFVRILGPSTHDHYTLVAAAKVKEGARIDKALRDVAKTLPEADRSHITFDAETAEGVKVHRITTDDPKAQKTFGKHPFYLAIRHDAAVLAGGPDALKAMKEVLAAGSGSAPSFVLDLSVSKLAVAAARQHGSAEQIKAVEEAAQRARGKDRVHVVVEGGKTLTVRATAEAEALKLLGKIAGQHAEGGKQLDDK